MNISGLSSTAAFRNNSQFPELLRDQLTISGRLGPCDLPNVVTISNENGTQWFGEITEFEQYRDLVDWAARSRDAGELLPLPKELQRHTLHPFRK
jgi:cobaltochelatase CobN